MRSSATASRSCRREPSTASRPELPRKKFRLAGQRTDNVETGALVPRLAIRTLHLVCASLPAAGLTNLGIRGDAVEIVDFYARATLVLPSGATQPNAEVRGGT